MKIDKIDNEKAVIVSVSGKLDGVTAPDLEQYLTDIEARSNAHIILNLADLQYISSAGLRVVLTIVKKLKIIQKELILSGLTGAVKDVFQLSGFYAILKVCDNTKEALSQL